MPPNTTSDLDRLIKWPYQCVDMILSPNDLPSNLGKMFEIKKAEAVAKGTGTSLSEE